MPEPKTFREATEQKEKIDQQYKFRDIGYRRFVQEMESLDSHIVSLTVGREALLDAAPEMLQILEAILSDRDGLDRLQAFTMNGEFYDPREVISAVIDKAKGGI